jgi:hypothetical protein
MTCQKINFEPVAPFSLGGSIENCRVNLSQTADNEAAKLVFKTCVSNQLVRDGFYRH